MKKYPTANRLRELFSYDKDSNSLRYAYKPYNKPHLLGQKVGHTDTRDGIYYVKVDGKSYVGKYLISIHQTGSLPVPVPHHTKWTREILHTLVHYDPVSGAFTRLQSAGGAKAGSRADYVENNGYRYVILNGKRMIAARLAWFYINGEWPKGRIFAKDENPGNISFANLELAEFGDLTIPAVKRAYDKAHRQRNPMWHRRHALKRDFGISLDQYQDVFAAQGGVCACCKKPEVSMRSGKRKWLAVDHDHASGEFRGLLCSNCNRGIGLFRDNPEILDSAAAYLRAHAAKPKTNVIPLAGRKIANERGN